MFVEVHVFVNIAFCRDRCPIQLDTDVVFTIIGNIKIDDT
jgi:hypothetical protein